MPSRKPSRALPPMKLSDIYVAPGHLIRRSQQIAGAIFFEEFEGYDVTPVQYAALIAIRDRPGMDQRTLVERRPWHRDRPPRPKVWTPDPNAANYWGLGAPEEMRK